MKLSALLVCLAALAGVSHAEDVNAVAKATYAAVDRAFVKRDANAVDAVMRPRITKDFKAIVAGRSVTYTDLVTNFRGLFAAVSKITSSTDKILSTKMAGDTATLKVHDELTAYAKGPDGKLHRLDLTNTSDDVWKKVGGKWKLATSTTLSESRRIDGKLQKP